MDTHQSLREQLLAEYERRWDADGLTLTALLVASGLDLSLPSLYRKLHGTQGLRGEEIEALATALGIEVTAGCDAGEAA
jgi:hypothetical protein